jgi:hypothetical protein
LLLPASCANAIGAPPAAGFGARNDENLRRATTGLGEERFCRAWVQGAVLSLDEAVVERPLRRDRRDGGDEVVLIRRRGWRQARRFEAEGNANPVMALARGELDVLRSPRDGRLGTEARLIERARLEAVGSSHQVTKGWFVVNAFSTRATPTDSHFEGVTGRTR